MRLVIFSKLILQINRKHNIFYFIHFLKEQYISLEKLLEVIKTNLLRCLIWYLELDWLWEVGRLWCSFIEMIMSELTPFIVFALWPIIPDNLRLNQIIGFGRILRINRKRINAVWEMSFPLIWWLNSSFNI